MAQFRGTLQGQRGAASRLGSKSSGITTTANGWTSGVKVLGSVDREGRDVFQLVQTGGSLGGDVREVGRIIDGTLYLSRAAITAATIIEDDAFTYEAVRAVA